MSFVRYVKLRVNAGQAKPGPAIGQALGPLGINMADFCKQFNDQTGSELYEPGIPLNVQLSALSDRTFTFAIKSPSTSYLLKRVTGITKGPSNPSTLDPIATIAPEAIYEIAKIKQQDALRKHLPLEGIARSVVGTAKSMGIVVREVKDDDQEEEQEEDTNDNNEQQQQA